MLEVSCKGSMFTPSFVKIRPLVQTLLAEHDTTSWYFLI